MYSILLMAHSIFRWLVLLTLIFAIYRSWRGYRSQFSFTKNDDAVRHWTATIAHVQLMLGIILYSQSPMVEYYFSNGRSLSGEPFFFGAIHILLMLIAIVVITMGSAKAKRKAADSDKFKTMLTWFSIALVIIFIAIPWPFSPLSHRPYFRF
jgi:cytochrome c biogenesis factor